MLVGDTLQLSSGSTEGTWLSPPLPALTLNKVKAHAIEADQSSFAEVVLEFRSLAASSGNLPSTWYPNISQLPQENYLQIKATFRKLLPFGPPLILSAIELEPDKPTLIWDRSHWSGSLEFPYPIPWTDGTLVGFDPFWAFFMLVLDNVNGAYVPQGKWTSPWLRAESAFVSKAQTVVAEVPPQTSITYRYRSSPDGTETSASSWLEVLGDVPDAPYFQVEIILATTDPSNTPILESLTISPA
jgi:hypothetical protein